MTLLLDGNAVRWSLRRSLLAILLLITVSVWVCGGIIVYLDAEQESQELFDRSLAKTAHLLLTLAEHEVEERMALTDHEIAESDVQEQSNNLLFQIWSQDNRLLYKNNGAPNNAITDGNSLGFGWAKINGVTWRTYTARNSVHPLQIQVAEPLSYRSEISGRFALKLLLAALMILPLMAGAIWWSINRLFRVLRRSADEVATRTPNDLRKVDLIGVPTELHSLLNAINHLFERVSNAMDQEQRFTANASHELRTPLAAIKTNLQVIQRARNDNERQEAVDGLLISVDRATRLVEQLMTLARLDPQHPHDPKLKKVNLATFLSDHFDEITKNLDVRNRVFSTQLDDAVCLINPDSMVILVRNLIDNATRYTEENDEIRLSSGIKENQAFLCVSDSGPGIPVEMREKIFERFFRLPGSQASGSGLGLSIVKNIVMTHGAKIEMSDGIGARGISITIFFSNPVDEHHR